VRQFVEWAFEETGVTLEWKGTGVEEKGMDAATGRVLVEVDKRYFRPTEVDLLLGDASKARKGLGWSHRVGVRDLVREMIAADLTVMRASTVMKEA
jgi:GDPmannose 4,6-dehydratase